jgi:hypothetical protein
VWQQMGAGGVGGLEAAVVYGNNRCAAAQQHQTCTMQMLQDIMLLDTYKRMHAHCIPVSCTPLQLLRAHTMHCLITTSLLGYPTCICVQQSTLLSHCSPWLLHSTQYTQQQ